MAPHTTQNASSTTNFQHLYTVKAFDKIPVHEYISKDTGLTVVIAEIEGPIVNGYFCLATEAFDDDGLPHTLEHLIFLASEKYPYKGVLDLLANRCLASGTNAWTDNDHTCYTVETAGYEGFLSLMPIYLDHILYPTLTDEGFITEVHHITETGEDAGVVYCEMQGCENSGESRLHLTMQRAVYPGHCGYSSNTGGIMKNLRESTNNEKVRNYHKSFYRPENLKLIITGQIKPEDIFKALEPIEKKIISKGERGPFTRPWQNPCPPIEKSEDLVIKYPSDDESNGMYVVSWRGPSSVIDLYNLNACIMLLTYLTDLSVAPLAQEFVETEDPYASEVSFSYLENSESCLYLLFENVPTDKLTLIKPKLFQVFDKIVNENSIDMKRIQSIINQQKLRHLNKVETGPHSAIANMIICHMLYGNTKEDLYNRINPLEHLDKMLQEPLNFWVALLNKWFINNFLISIQAIPSREEQVQIAEQEKTRIDAQIASLGNEGLVQKKNELEKAIEHNNRTPPPELLTCVPIPGIEKIKFHEIKRFATNSPDHSLIDLSKTPILTYCDHVDTKFAYLVVLMDTSVLSAEQRLHLPILLESFLESPIERDEKIIPYEEVVAQLQDDTILSSTSIGFGGSSPMNFRPGEYSFMSYICLDIEQQKIGTGVNWLKELLYQTRFTVERLKIIISKMINNIPLLKRSGSGMVKHLMKEMRFVPDSNQYATNPIRQQTFLNKILEKLDSDEASQVIVQIEDIRSNICQPDNLALYCATNLNTINVDLTALLNDFIPKELNIRSNEFRLNVVPDWHFHVPTNHPRDTLTMGVVGMGCLDSTEFVQTTNSVNNYKNPDMPVILVYAQYLTQAEGPLWKQIRGKGYAYGYNITLKVHEGLLYLSFSRATNVVGAYREAYNIVTEQIANKVWDQTLLESAKSSLIYEFIKNEDTICSVTVNALSYYFYEVDYEYSKTLLHLIKNVSVEDLNRVGDVFFKNLFDPLYAKTAIVTDPSKAEEIANEFRQQFGMDPKVYPSLEESFLAED